MEIKKEFEIETKELKLNPDQPRKEYDDMEIQSLADNIRLIGQLEPVIIDENNYILSGHRRFKAITEKLKQTKIWVRRSSDLTQFQKNSVILASNILVKRFNTWEVREAIGNVFWNYFLEEYPQPTGVNDKGYSAFGKYIGISASEARKIIEATNPKNKKIQTIISSLKKANASASLVDEVLSGKKDDIPWLADEAIKKLNTENTLAVRNDIRELKRQRNLEISGNVSHNVIKIIENRILTLNEFFNSELLKKSSNEQLEKLKKLLEKRIIPFYEKIQERI
jgi:hypothetical protein